MRASPILHSCAPHSASAQTRHPVSRAKARQAGAPWNQTTPGSIRSTSAPSRAVPKLAGAKLATAGGGALHDVGEADPVTFGKHRDGGGRFPDCGRLKQNGVRELPAVHPDNRSAACHEPRTHGSSCRVRPQLRSS